ARRAPLSGRGLVSRAGGLSEMEPKVAITPGPPGQPPDRDPSAYSGFCLAPRKWTQPLAGDPPSRNLRIQSPESSRRSGDPGSPSRRAAVSPGPSHGQGILQGPLLPAGLQPPGLVHE